MRILFVGMPDSVHTARWINQVSNLGWDIHLFSSNSAPPHQDLRNITVYNISFSRPEGLDRSVRLRGLWPSRIGAERLSEKVPYPIWLARIIRWLKPDIIHSMEIQQAGYLTQNARTKFTGRFPTWMVTNWGSDIYFYGRIEEHAEKIRRVLTTCDYYVCECQRDVKLAREFGLTGTVLPVVPGGGGFEVRRLLPLRQPGPVSARRVIALKGYQHWSGRALFGLRAIELCAKSLAGYRIVVYSANADVKLAAELTARSTGIPIEILPNSPHEQVMRLHGRARMSIGLSISDAISTSMLEAIIMGSFPIQSQTSCADEWVSDGETGLLVPPEDPEAIAVAIRRAAADDELVDRADEINTRVASERLDYSVIQPKVVEMYQSITKRAEGVKGV